MHKWLIMVFLLISLGINAQKEPIDFQTVDSLSYNYYLKGDWDKLITLGEQAIRTNIDFKRLHQRMGYAYFLKKDYFAAKQAYEKALAFDEYDADSRVFLYYCGINLGDEDFARFHAAKLSDEIKQSLDIKPLRLIDAIDLEYNKKINNSNERSNPIYYRLGVNSQLGYRLSLYQSVSKYSQSAVIDSTGLSKITQSEYYGLLRYSLTANTNLMVGFHYLNTAVDALSSGSKLYYGAITTKWNRFSLGANASFMTNKMGKYKQLGLSASYNIPSQANIYLKSSINYLTSSGQASLSSGQKRFVFGEAVGGQIMKNVWGEANLLLGNIKNYNDNNALYVYNTLDATTFRTGFTLFWNLSNKITIFSNYSFDKKKIESFTTTYNQQSFLGGIRWKL